MEIRCSYLMFFSKCFLGQKEIYRIVAINIDMNKDWALLDITDIGQPTHSWFKNIFSDNNGD